MEDPYTEAMAIIITTGDVPLSLRNQMNMSNTPTTEQVVVRLALQAAQSGEYDGLTKEQVIAKLKQNQKDADS